MNVIGIGLFLFLAPCGQAPNSEAQISPSTAEVTTDVVRGGETRVRTVPNSGEGLGPGDHRMRDNKLAPFITQPLACLSLSVGWLAAQGAAAQQTQRLDGSAQE